MHLSKSTVASTVYRGRGEKKKITVMNKRSEKNKGQEAKYIGFHDNGAIFFTITMFFFF